VKGNTKNNSVIPDTGCFTSKAVQEKFAKLGVNNEISLILHLPLRYEDETHLCQISDISGGETVQTEGIIISSEVMYRPRRQLVLQVEDDSGILFIRFLNF
jgi:ATP-dependent DNA helicase RecG